MCLHIRSSARVSQRFWSGKVVKTTGTVHTPTSMTTTTTTFKAASFRLNRSSQYADHLWLKGISTVASPSTTGRTDSLSAAYLPNGDTAIPNIFGKLSWSAPTTGTENATCNIQVLSPTSQELVTAASFTAEKTSFSGAVRTAAALEFGDTWRISVDPLTESLRFEKMNQDTGVYEPMQSITST
jgi:hypothetical protein